MALDTMLQIRDFQSFKLNPLPSDQKLLTLMHFNVVRGLCQVVDALEYKVHELYTNVQSPLVDPAYQAKDQQCLTTTLTDFSALPATVQPTALQKVIPHHPEYDCFPFPRYRDNVIMASHNKTINPAELCMDVCYGVDTGPIWAENKTRDPGANDMVKSGTKTGFILVSTLTFPLYAVRVKTWAAKIRERKWMCSYIHYLLVVWMHDKQVTATSCQKRVSIKTCPIMSSRLNTCSHTKRLVVARR
jgi:hypothetical protein